MTWNFTEQIFGKYKKYVQKMNARGPPPFHEGGGTPAPLGRAPYLVGPLELLRLQLQLYILCFGEKKLERRIHRILWYGAAAKP